MYFVLLETVPFVCISLLNFANYKLKKSAQIFVFSVICVLSQTLFKVNMNTLSGKIESVAEKGSLSLVKVKVASVTLSAIVIDTHETAAYLQPGHAVKVVFKETEVIIGKGGQHEISLQNKLSGTIEKIETGELLAKLTLATEVGKVVSVITANAVKQLELGEGSEVVAMIKTNEMMLSE